MSLIEYFADYNSQKWGGWGDLNPRPPVPQTNLKFNVKKYYLRLLLYTHFYEYWIQ